IGVPPHRPGEAHVPALTRSLNSGRTCLDKSFELGVSGAGEDNRSVAALVEMLRLDGTRLGDRLEQSIGVWVHAQNPRGAVADAFGTYPSRAAASRIRSRVAWEIV